MLRRPRGGFASSSRIMFGTCRVPDVLHLVSLYRMNRFRRISEGLSMKPILFDAQQVCVISTAAPLAGRGAADLEETLSTLAGVQQVWIVPIQSAPWFCDLPAANDPVWDEEIP